jgi:hypothetical protein
VPTLGGTAGGSAPAECGEFVSALAAIIGTKAPIAPATAEVITKSRLPMRNSDLDMSFSVSITVQVIEVCGSNFCVVAHGLCSFNG